MALADKARDAFRPTNVIEAVLEPTRDTQNRPDTQPLAGPETRPQTPSARPDAKDKAAPYLSEPESIAKRYYVEERRGERQYFEDYQRKNIAMRATDSSISTKREDLNTVRAMLEIAQARGWHSVEIRGSTEFKREAWIEATARGLEGRGYTPSDADRQEADRRATDHKRANEVREVEKAEAREEKAEARSDKATGRNEQAASHQAAAAEHEKKSHEKQPGEPEAPTLADNRRSIREARKELSEDGRTLVNALAEKIDRQMNRLNLEAKTEIKAFVASELVKKERAEGPIVFSPEQKRALAAPEPVKEATRAQPAPERRFEPEAPRRSRAM